MNEKSKLTFKPSLWREWITTNGDNSGHIVDSSAYRNMVNTIIASQGSYEFDNIDDTVDINDVINDAYHDYLAAREKLQNLLKIAQKYS